MSHASILNLAKRIKSIADVGLLYSTDEYDRERYHELLGISQDLLVEITDKPLEDIRNSYSIVKDYPTAKVDIRGIAFSPEGKILLTKESNDQRWSLPGGWADIGYTPREVITKEFKEETGLDIVPEQLLAIFDKKVYAHPSQPLYVYKMAFLCTITSDQIQKGFDVLDVQYFSPDDLPPLSEDRIVKRQIEILVDKVRRKDLMPHVD